MVSEYRGLGLVVDKALGYCIRVVFVNYIAILIGELLDYLINPLNLLGIINKEDILIRLFRPIVKGLSQYGKLLIKQGLWLGIKDILNGVIGKGIKAELNHYKGLNIRLYILTH